VQGASPSDAQDQFFSADRVSYRTLPTPAFALAVLKRNAVIMMTTLIVFSPFVLLKVLVAGKTYESSIYLRFDPSDSLQFEGRISDSIDFPEAAQFLAREVDDLTFIEELAKRFPPTELEYPGHILVDQYQELAFLKWFLSAPSKEIDLEKRGKFLRSRLNFFTDIGIRGSPMMRLVGAGPSIEDAKRLASIAANLLIERFYAKEVKKVEIGLKALNEFLQNEKVKSVVENAKNGPKDQFESRGSSRNNAEALRDIKTRQATAQSRIREINEQIRTSVSRRARLEASLGEVSQRYGPFHPERRALESEISDLRSKDGMSALSRELKRLEEQLIEAEADADAVVANDDQEERADRTIQRIYGKLDRLKLEEQKLSEQVTKPTQRTRLSTVGDPSTPTNFSSSARPKIAAIGGAAALVVALLLMVLRELTRKKCTDKWVIDWILNMPCLLQVASGKLASVPLYDKRSIQSLRQRIAKGENQDESLRMYLDLRSLGLWIKNMGRGQVILFTRSSNELRSDEVVHSAAAVYSRDYAGRCLLIDLNSKDTTEDHQKEEASASLLDVILQKVPFEQAVIKIANDRGYDLMVSNLTLEMRLSEVISSAKFAEFMASARRIYHKIFIFGLGPENFVENNTLLSRSSDCIIVIDAANANRKQLKRIKTTLESEKVVGYILIES
jgi:hypothetical protein